MTSTPRCVRPGRFDRSIYFGLPGRSARADIVAYYLGKKAHGEDLDEHEAVDRVAGMTSGYSPAALERLLDEALVIALTHGRTAMSMPDVAEAKMLVELGVTDPSIYTPEERVRVATHEAGHATVAHFLGRSRQLDVLSIVKRRDSLGLLQHSDTEERFTQRRDEMNALLQISMGGLVAEERWFDEVSTGPAGDLSTATTFGAQMIGACGMGESLISIAAAGNGLLSGGLVEKVLADKDARAELDALLTSSRDAAPAIVTEHGAVVEALRDALLERDELVGREITEVIASCLRRRVSGRRLDPRSSLPSRSGGKVGRVVEAAQDPSLGRQDEPGDRRVVGHQEGKRPRPGGLSQDLADGRAVGERHHPGAGVRRGDPLDRPADARGELRTCLSAGHHVPALLGQHLHRHRIGVGHLLAEQAALPLAHEHLAQIGFDQRGEAGPPDRTAPPSRPCAATW